MNHSNVIEYYNFWFKGLDPLKHFYLDLIIIL